MIKPDIPRDVLKLWRAFDRYNVSIVNVGYADEYPAVEMQVDGVEWSIFGYAPRFHMESSDHMGKTFTYSDEEIRAQYAKNPVSLELKR